MGRLEALSTVNARYALLTSRSMFAKVYCVEGIPNWSASMATTVTFLYPLESLIICQFHSKIEHLHGRLVSIITIPFKCV